MKKLIGPSGFIIYGESRNDFFSSSAFFYPNRKVGLRLSRGGPNFHTISNIPNVSLEIVDCSFHTRIALKDDHSKKTRDMIAYTLVQVNFLETLAICFDNPARTNQFIHENFFNSAPVRRVTIAMNTKSALIGSYTKNPIWCQWRDLRQIKKLRVGQPIIDSDASDNCGLHVTKMKKMNIQGDIPSITIDSFRDH